MTRVHLTVVAVTDGVVYQIGDVGDSPAVIPVTSPWIIAARVVSAEPEMPRRTYPMADLDRCVHGRHSIDDCLCCPGGMSWGNPYAGAKSGRVGTDYSGHPIDAVDVVDYNPAAVIARRPPRESEKS